MSPRVADAFSLRQNLRRLFVPPTGHLSPLDGIRALSILWVVCFHAGWYARFSLPLWTWMPLVSARWMLPFWRGDFGVDLFFVLSGFLIAGMLLDEEAANGRVALGLFYVRRLFRLWPALFAIIVIDVFTDDPHKSVIWINALYVNNFVPIWVVGLGWTWSLAIEEQFYLVCPWVLRAIFPLPVRGRVAALAGLMTCLVVIAAYVVVSYDLHPFDAEIVGQLDPFRWGLAFDVMYDKPWMRAGALFAGVMGAVLYRCREVMECLGRARVGTGVGLVLAMVTMALSTHWPLAVGGSRFLEVAYLATFRTFFGLGAAFVILVTLSAHPMGKSLARLLSARWLFPISQLAYSAYLLNPTVTTWVGRVLGPHIGPGDEPMHLLMPCDAIATFACAAVIHLAVERPGMELRPRATLSQQAPLEASAGDHA